MICEKQNIHYKFYQTYFVKKIALCRARLALV